jgi:hypothetical protein
VRIAHAIFFVERGEDLMRRTRQRQQATMAITIGRIIVAPEVGGNDQYATLTMECTSLYTYSVTVNTRTRHKEGNDEQLASLYTTSINRDGCSTPNGSAYSPLYVPGTHTSDLLACYR